MRHASCDAPSRCRRRQISTSTAPWIRSRSTSRPSRGSSGRMAAWGGGRTARGCWYRALSRTACRGTGRDPTCYTRRSGRCCAPVDTAHRCGMRSETRPRRSTTCRLVLVVPPVVDDAAAHQEVLKGSCSAVQCAPDQPQGKHYARDGAQQGQTQRKVTVVAGDDAKAQHGVPVAAAWEPPADGEVHRRNDPGGGHGEPP